MKLLLDEMHSHLVAESLEQRGHDVSAVVFDPRLRGLPDPELMSHAYTEGRAIVTENVGDFMRIHRSWSAEGSPHAGLVLTHPRRFPRGQRRYPGDLVEALSRFLGSPEPAPDSWVHWL